MSKPSDTPRDALEQLAARFKGRSRLEVSDDEDLMWELGDEVRRLRGANERLKGNTLDSMMDGALAATPELERLRAELAEKDSFSKDLVDTIEEYDKRPAYTLGWFVADAEYPEEGWVGPFDTRDEAVAWATDADPEVGEDHWSFRQIGDVAHMTNKLATAEARVRDEVELEDAAVVCVCCAEGDEVYRNGLTLGWHHIEPLHGDVLSCFAEKIHERRYQRAQREGEK